MTARYKRWYDYDPVLMEVIELLRSYQEELKAQAEVFLTKIEAQVGKETVEKFYEMVRPKDGGNRWYDKDPILSRTIELLRVVPPDVQKKAAQSFLDSLDELGLDRNIVKQSNTES